METVKRFFRFLNLKTINAGAIEKLRKLNAITLSRAAS
jgi:hypothetical protein